MERKHQTGIKKEIKKDETVRHEVKKNKSERT